MNQLDFIEDGQPLATILLDPGATPTELLAAHELQSHLELVSGTRLPLSREVPSDDRQSCIRVGRNAAAEALTPEFDWASLGEEGCIVRTTETSLILAGATPQGSLHAVYEYLERELDIHWLTPECTILPPRRSLSSGNLDFRHVPPFQYRELFYAKNEDAKWTRRNRLNGHFAPADGGPDRAWKYAGFVHTFATLVPPNEYFSTHPEFFSERLTPLGRRERTAHRSQLCLTNPDVLEVVVTRVREQLELEPEARVVSVSQNDCNAPCQCADCSRLDEAEGSPSGTLIHFVNAVAERLESEYPHVFFDTLAYQYTVVPPRHARPRHNVIVRLCHLSDACDLHPLQDCGVNAPFLEHLRGWRDIAPRVFIWDYFNNFNHYFAPLPNLDGILADIPFMACLGVDGLFAQTDGRPPKGSGDMGELRAYLLARLLWNPGLNGRHLINEFLTGYYGAAASSLQDYLELMHSTVRSQDVHLDAYPSLHQPHNSPLLLQQAEGLLDAALNGVRNDAVLTERVRAATLPLEFMWMKRHLRFAIEGSRYAPAPQVVERVRPFLELAQKSGAGSLQECEGGRTLTEELEILKGFPLVSIDTDEMCLTVAPAMGGRLLSLREQRGKSEWMFSGSPDDLLYPLAGGYEEYSESWWHAPGWNQHYKCEAQPNSLKLTADLANGLRLQRKYSVEAGYRLNISSELGNVSDQPRRAVLRTHAEFAVDEWQSAFLVSRSSGGSFTRTTPWLTIEAGHLWMENDDLPAGCWGLVRQDGELLMGFDTSVIETCLLDWNKKEGVLRFDAISIPRDLDPGQTLVVNQQWMLEARGPDHPTATTPPPRTGLW